MSKLAALWRARERLEVALAPDESWQLLQRLGGAAGGRGAEAASLEAQLLSNPVYRAWKNVNAAILARQPDKANAAGPAPLTQATPTLAAAHAAERSEPRRPGTGALAEEEASVSFVARTPVPARMEEPPHGQGRSPEGQNQMFARPEAEGPQCEEAEVSVVSVDARRHADAVDRLLRALRGDSQG